MLTLRGVTGHLFEEGPSSRDLNERRSEEGRSHVENLQKSAAGRGNRQRTCLEVETCLVHQQTGKVASRSGQRGGSWGMRSGPRAGPDQVGSGRPRAVDSFWKVVSQTDAESKAA